MKMSLDIQGTSHENPKVANCVHTNYKRVKLSNFAKQSFDFII